MATNFLHLCDQILTASSPHTPYDAQTKPLCTLLNDMTSYVAKTVNFENEDEFVGVFFILDFTTRRFC